MRHETRLSLDIERDWEWMDWPEEYQDAETWEDDGLSVVENPNQIVWD